MRISPTPELLNALEVAMSHAVQQLPATFTLHPFLVRVSAVARLEEREGVTTRLIAVNSCGHHGQKDRRSRTGIPRNPDDKLILFVHDLGISPYECFHTLVMIAVTSPLLDTLAFLGIFGPTLFAASVTIATPLAIARAAAMAPTHIAK